MAYYENAPQKRKKVNYAEQGSWEEEGSRYRDRTERKGDGPRTGRRNSAFGSAREDGPAGPRSRRPYSGGKRNFSAEDRNGEKRFRDDRTEASREFRDRTGSAPDRRFRSPEARRSPEREREAPPERAKGYRDFEYRGLAPESLKERDGFRAEDSADSGDRILCGRNPIREALRSGREIEKLLVQKGELNGTAREIVQEAREKKIMVQEVDRRRLDEIALHHQGLIAFASEYAYAEVDEMLELARQKQEDPFLVILDGVTDPHNLGAIIRTAECVGAHGVIIPLHRSVGLTPSAVKASAGAIEHMKVARVTNLNRIIDDLKKQGIWIYAVTMDGRDYEKVDFHGGTALVIGAEGEGISRLTEEKCDLKVSLPMKGHLDSLNASVAAGVIMYRVLGCRKK